MVYSLGMDGRRSEFDVTNRVNVTDPEQVCQEVCRLLVEMFPGRSVRPIEQAYRIVTDLFRGDYPGYRPCDTPYHDLQHTLDVSLTMTRLLYGHEVGRKQDSLLGHDLTILGVVGALFHDSGYVRRLGDRRYRNGAAYTHKHVTRSGRFLATILPQLGLEHMTVIAKRLVHFTGYEVAVSAIRLRDSDHRMLGTLLGTADLMAQMSDRCYLEKCRDRLFPEFVVAGIAGDDNKWSLYSTPDALIFNTPKFFRHVLDDRLNRVLKGVYSYADAFFLPQKNAYQEAIERNADYLNHVVKARDISLLRREPPWTLAVRSEEVLSAV